MNKSEFISITDSEHLNDVQTFPKYRRDRIVNKIGHLGLGNFHRSHEAFYLHKLLQNQTDAEWGIHGVGMLPQDKAFIESLQSQTGLYTLTERSADDDVLHVVGSIVEASHGPSETTEIIEKLAHDEVKIISLTVTEKGYYNTAAGDLDIDNERIKNDLQENSIPVTVHGYLHAIAEHRMRHDGQPFTVMSCDNLPGNGSMAQRLLLEFATLKNPEVAAWIRENVAFPNSMVDRITPVTTPETVAFVQEKFGIDDNAPVISEDFIQWVIEDNFSNGRPQFEKVGAQFVPSVEPYEVLKTRMLNGAHSALAYCAYLMGYRKVDEAMRDPLVNEYLKRYMDEDITPTIPDVPGIDLEDYKLTLRKRFANPAVSDQIQRLAMDGSAKVRTFIAPPLIEQLRGDGSIKWMAFALATWSRYLSGKDENGEDIEVNDPLKDKLVGSVASASDLLGMNEVFDFEIARDERLTNEVNDVIEQIKLLGIRETLARRLAE